MRSASGERPFLNRFAQTHSTLPSTPAPSIKLRPPVAPRTETSVRSARILPRAGRAPTPDRAIESLPHVHTFDGDVRYFVAGPRPNVTRLPRTRMKSRQLPRPGISNHWRSAGHCRASSTNPVHWLRWRFHLHVGLAVGRDLSSAAISAEAAEDHSGLPTGTPSATARSRPKLFYNCLNTLPNFVVVPMPPVSAEYSGMPLKMDSSDAYFPPP